MTKIFKFFYLKICNFQIWFLCKSAFMQQIQRKKLTELNTIKIEIFLIVKYWKISKGAVGLCESDLKVFDLVVYFKFRKQSLDLGGLLEVT